MQKKELAMVLPKEDHSSSGQSAGVLVHLVVGPERGRKRSAVRRAQCQEVAGAAGVKHFLDVLLVHHTTREGVAEELGQGNLGVVGLDVADHLLFGCGDGAATVELDAAAIGQMHRADFADHDLLVDELLGSGIETVVLCHAHDGFPFSLGWADDRARGANLRQRG